MLNPVTLEKIKNVKNCPVCNLELVKFNNNIIYSGENNFIICNNRCYEFSISSNHLQQNINYLGDYLSIRRMLNEYFYILNFLNIKCSEKEFQIYDFSMPLNMFFNKIKIRKVFK
jgi:hypothetical protein